MSTPEELSYYKEIFMQGFWLCMGFNLTGLMIRIVRMIKRRGPDVLD